MTYNGNHLFHYMSFLSVLKIISLKKLWGSFLRHELHFRVSREVFAEVAVEELNKLQWQNFEYRTLIQT